MQRSEEGVTEGVVEVTEAVEAEAIEVVGEEAVVDKIMARLTQVMVSDPASLAIKPTLFEGSRRTRRS